MWHASRGGRSGREFLELVAELAEAHAEELGRARLHPTRPRQREVDVALLDLVERRLEVEPALRNLDRDVEDVAGPPEVRRERVHVEHLAAPEDQRALDHVLELADVAGPPVALEDRERRGGHGAHGLAELRRPVLDEVGDEQRDVLAPLAQRRDVDRDDVEAVEEILSEDPVLHGLRDVAVRCRDQAHVHLDVLRVPDAPDLALLDHAQELHLERWGDLRDLVEEERAAVGGRKEAHGARDRARERPLDVTEELRLHQGLWDRAAVDRDERPVPAGALRVDGAGDELLAGAALARDEDGGQAVGGLPDGLEALEPPAATADDA